ncbi:MAG: hypothetical protein K9L17_02510 [Clostridiales bacterium]|nr:hypothetical protein [Clostridiales bacterium]MCF8021551.1 hypothetical protein [Clostridiales bacterium]
MEIKSRKFLGNLFVMLMICLLWTSFFAIPVSASENMQRQEMDLVNMINDTRIENDTAGLQVDKQLNIIACQKAEDMASKDYLSYTSPTYGNIEEMLQDKGFQYKNITQKIARTSSSVSASYVHKALMRYDKHKSDIIDNRYKLLGVGIASTERYKYIVELLAEKEELTTPGSSLPGGQDPGQQENEQDNSTPGEGEELEKNNSMPEKNNDSFSQGDAEKELLKLINDERSSSGLENVKLDNTLSKLASLKTEDMVENGYFKDNYNFVYESSLGKISKMLNDEGVKYASAGENLIIGSSVSSIHNYQVKYSPGYREDILNKDYDRVGIDVRQGEKYKYIVQVFIDNSGSEMPDYIENQEQNTGPTDNNLAHNDTTQSGTKTSSSDVQGLSADEQEILAKINKERISRGIGELEPNLELTEVARTKARDMIEKGYFAHNSPTYGTPFDMMSDFGIDYGYAGENLAGAPEVSRAHTALMNSPGHRENILNSNFKEVGIGVIDGGPYGKMFVQMFIDS